MWGYLVSVSGRHRGYRVFSQSLGSGSCVEAGLGMRYVSTGWSRALVVMLMAVLVCLGWATAVGKASGWWVWPAWLATFSAVTVLASFPKNTSTR